MVLTTSKSNVISIYWCNDIYHDKYSIFKFNDIINVLCMVVRLQLSFMQEIIGGVYLLA